MNSVRSGDNTPSARTNRSNSIVCGRPFVLQITVCLVTPSLWISIWASARGADPWATPAHVRGSRQDAGGQRIVGGHNAQSEEAARGSRPAGDVDFAAWLRGEVNYPPWLLGKASTKYYGVKYLNGPIVPDLMVASRLSATRSRARTRPVADFAWVLRIYDEASKSGKSPPPNDAQNQTVPFSN